jgi:hypothetical protein
LKASPISFHGDFHDVSRGDLHGACHANVFYGGFLSLLDSLLPWLVHCKLERAVAHCSEARMIGDAEVAVEVEKLDTLAEDRDSTVELVHADIAVRLGVQGRDLAADIADNAEAEEKGSNLEERILAVRILEEAHYAIFGGKEILEAPEKMDLGLDLV